MRKNKKIYITELDRDRLTRFLEEPRDEEQNGLLDPLRAELSRAVVVASQEVPADVITMNSTASLVEVDSSEEEVYTLVFPRDADAEEGKVSVAAPLGTAMLGYRVGDVFEWEVPMGKKRWRVAKVIYQPEAAGNYDL